MKARTPVSIDVARARVSACDSFGAAGCVPHPARIKVAMKSAQIPLRMTTPLERECHFFGPRPSPRLPILGRGQESAAAADSRIFPAQRIGVELLARHDRCPRRSAVRWTGAAGSWSVRFAIAKVIVIGRVSGDVAQRPPGGSCGAARELNRLGHQSLSAQRVAMYGDSLRVIFFPLHRIDVHTPTASTISASTIMARIPATTASRR